MPDTIHELATSLLGQEGVQELSSAATSTSIMLAGRNYTLWSTSADDTFSSVEREFGGDSCRESCIYYKYPELKRVNGGLAVDVGGNIGDTSFLAFAHNPRLQIMTLEASPQTYVLFKWNLLQNKIPEIMESDITSGSGKPGILAIHAALTGNGKPIEFKYAPERSYNAMMSSSVTAWGSEITYPGKDYQNLKWITMTVPGFSLIDWFAKHRKVAKPVWFKMDCEGCEYDTLVDLDRAGILEHAIVAGEAHPRLLKDSSCEDNMERSDCQEAVKAITETQRTMCRKYSFTSCRRVLTTALFQERAQAWSCSLGQFLASVLPWCRAL